MPELPDSHIFDLAPDWVCEVLSLDTICTTPRSARWRFRHAPLRQDGKLNDAFPAHGLPPGTLDACVLHHPQRPCMDQAGSTSRPLDAHGSKVQFRFEQGMPLFDVRLVLVDQQNLLFRCLPRIQVGDQGKDTLRACLATDGCTVGACDGPDQPLVAAG
jgi:hypothetical protein